MVEGRALALVQLLCLSCSCPEEAPRQDARPADGTPWSDGALPDSALPDHALPAAIDRLGVDGPNRVPSSIAAQAQLKQIPAAYFGLNGLHWHLVQSERDGSYDWSIFDALLDLYRTAGKVPQITLSFYHYPGHWALDFHPTLVASYDTGVVAPMILGIKPQQKAAYQQLIRAICQRVGQPFILQIGCEQGNSWFDAARFAEAVDWAHQAAKAVDPEIVVWAGGFNAGVYFGLTAAQQAELRAAPGIGPAMQHKLQFYQAFLEQRPAMDALSLHLNRDLAYVRPTVSWFREQLDARGLTGAAIAVEDMLSGPWFHPCSIPNPLGCQDDALQQLAAGDPAFVEQYRRDQARGLVQKTSAALALGVRRVLVSTDVDWSGYHMEIWNHQGLVDGAGARKYAFFAFERLAGYLGRFRSAEPLRYDDDGVYLLAFTLADGRRLWLAWKDAASAAAQLTVSGVEGATVEAVPALPRFSAPVTFDPSETLPVEEGRVTIDLGTEPMYYVEAG